METVLLYIVYNALLFGGLYALAKAIEAAVWYAIENYDRLTQEKK